MRKTQQASTGAQQKFDSKKYARGHQTQAQVTKIKEYFDLFDVEGTGFINPKQLKEAMRQLGYQSTNHTVYQLICDYDADGKGSIGFQDFLHLMNHHTIRKVFSLYDDEKTGFISIKNLRRVAADLGQDISQQNLQLMLRRADTDKDGYVSPAQFYAIISKIAQN